MKMYPPEFRSTTLRAALLDLWEASVRATHHFLTEADIHALRPAVATGLAGVPHLIVAHGTDGNPAGFAGVDSTMLEMLFLNPAVRGQGLGKRLLLFAMDRFGVDRLDVNEQNPQAMGFYAHCGFVATGRSATDASGNPFPIVHMERGRQSGAVGTYHIRHARPEDIPVLGGIERSAARLFPPDLLPARMLDETVPACDLARAADAARLFVAVDGSGNVVGYALMETGDSYALLAQMDVLPEHGRKGLGTALLRRVVDAARAAGLDSLYLTTFRNIPWNTPFYARLGFDVMEPEKVPDAIGAILTQEQAMGLYDRVAMRKVVREGVR